MTALAGTEPVIGAQAAPAHRLQWFLSESAWDAAAITARRQELLLADPTTAPLDAGVLIIDETGDPEDGANVDRPFCRMGEQGGHIAMGRGGGEFGHPGNGGSIGFADPARKLGFGLTKNLLRSGLDRDKTAAYLAAETIRQHLDGATRASQ